MKTQLLPIVLFILLTAILPSTLHGASQGFLNLEGIEGESMDKEHQGEIEVLSFEIGVTRPEADSTGGAASTGKATFSDFTVTKRLDKASPKLFLAAARGEHIPEAVFVVRSSGVEPVEYFKVTMEDVLVSSVHTHGSTENDSVPIETVGLKFSRIEWEYVPVSGDGKPGTPERTGWDLEQNTRIQ